MSKASSLPPDPEIVETSVRVRSGLEATRHKALVEASKAMASMEVGGAVQTALNAHGKSLRQVGREAGIDPAHLSRIARGIAGERGCTVATIAQIALAMNKSLKITIE